MLLKTISAKVEKPDLAKSFSSVKQLWQKSRQFVLDGREKLKMLCQLHNLAEVANSTPL